MKSVRLNPSRTVVTSFNPRTTTASARHGGTAFTNYGDRNIAEAYYEQGDWVMCVTGGHNQWICCALSNGEIQVYDQQRMHSQQTYKLSTNDHSGKRSIVTDVVSDTSSSNPHVLVATATDGTVTVFDVRQSQPSCQWRLPRPEEQALSVSLGYGGTLAAVGSSKAKIHFFDVRKGLESGGGNNNLLGTYNQSHTKEVTRVRFQTKSSSSSTFGETACQTTPLLLSAGEDGLACVFDTSQPSEETALKNIYNVQSSVRQVGFFGPQYDAIYCLTGSESLKLFHVNDSNCRKNYGPNFRHDLGQLFGSTTSSSGSNSSTFEAQLPMEYLVDCHWDVPRQELLLLAGTSIGDAGVFQIQDDGNISVAHRLCSGHKGVLRGWSSLSTNSFVTVGEDARMCEWNRSHPSSSTIQPQRSVPQSTVVQQELHGAIPLAPTNMPLGCSNGDNTKKWLSQPHKQVLKAGGGPMRRRPRNKLTASPY